jgi:hypothetical protein
MVPNQYPYLVPVSGTLPVFTPTRRDAHTYGGTTCCMRARVQQCNRPASDTRDSGTSADRPVVAAACRAWALCAVGAGRVAVKASGRRRAGVGRMCSDVVVAPAGGACRALRRVRSIPSRRAAGG